MKPKEIKKFEELMNNHRAIATKKNGRLHKVSSGYYLVFLNSEIVQLYQQRDVTPHWWIAREYNNEWYSNPMPTLCELKFHIGLED